MPAAKEEQPTNYAGIAIAIIIAIAALVWLFNVISANKKEASTRTKSRYIAAISQWIKTEHPSKKASELDSIAECAYEADSDILYYRSRLKDEEDKRNENSPINSGSPYLRVPFLDSLESYVNGGDGMILQEEHDRITKAINKCL